MSFYCRRCKSTGQITEQYVELPPLRPPSEIDAPLPAVEYKIKHRKRECPDCLGFAAVGDIL